MMENNLLFRQWLESSYLIDQDEFGDDVDNKIEAIVLVGPPCIGKSTYINKLLKVKDYIIVSRDNIVDKFCDIYDLEYHEMFDQPPTNAQVGEYVSGKEKYGIVIQAPSWMTWAKVVYSKLFELSEKINQELKNDFLSAIESKKDFIVDMTNMDAKSRSRVLYYIKGKEEEYFKKAVVFVLKHSDLDALISRLQNRNEKTKKKISFIVLEKMIKAFQKVTPEEGFDKVETFDNF